MTEKQKAFVAEVKAVCELNYEAGGDEVVECFTDEEIVKQFLNLEEVKDYCGMKIEQSLNTRWGEDDDPELKRSEAFDAWKWTDDRDAAPRTCILTGAPGEDEDDCTTHEHE